MWPHETTAKWPPGDEHVQLSSYKHFKSIMATAANYIAIGL